MALWRGYIRRATLPRSRSRPSNCRASATGVVRHWRRERASGGRWSNGAKKTWRWRMPIARAAATTRVGRARPRPSLAAAQSCQVARPRRHPAPSLCPPRVPRAGQTSSSAGSASAARRPRLPHRLAPTRTRRSPPGTTCGAVAVLHRRPPEWLWSRRPQPGGRGGRGGADGCPHTMRAIPQRTHTRAPPRPVARGRRAALRQRSRRRRARHSPVPLK